MKFNYLVFDANSKTQKGVIDAPNLKEATKLLISQGWYIRKISPKGTFKIGFHNFGPRRISLIDKALFAKHLGTMLKSGINLNEALEVIADQTTSRNFRRTIVQIMEKVKAGKNLADSLLQFPRVFDQLMINIIRVGEESGTLEENLEYLANELEDRLELKRNVQTAIFYPAIILTAALLEILLLAYFVLPKIKGLFESLNVELPFMTRVLIWLANLMENHGLVLILGLIGFVLGLKVLTKQQFFKPIWHWFLIKLPLIGSALISYNLVLITRNLGVLLKSGLPIDQAIATTTDTITNVVYKKKFISLSPEIQKGKRFSDILSEFKQSKHKPLFPLIVTKMIGVGERSGRLDESLLYLADYFEKEVYHTTKNLSVVLEPLLLIFIGVIIIFIALSIVSPIFQVLNQFN